MEVTRGKQNIPDPHKFDLITHHWDRSGQLTHTNLYTCYVMEGNKYFERPVNSGNLWFENNEPAGRVEKEFDNKGGVIKKAFDFAAPHKVFAPKLEGNDALKYQVESERARADELAKELAAIKAERAEKSAAPAKVEAKQAAKAESEPTLGKVMG